MDLPTDLNLLPDLMASALPARMELSALPSPMDKSDQPGLTVARVPLSARMDKVAEVLCLPLPPRMTMARRRKDLKNTTVRRPTLS